MLGHRTLFKVAQLFEAIAKHEGRVELARQDLASNTLFEPYGVFRHLDEGLKGYVLARDVQQFLLNNGISASLREVDLVLATYSSTSRLTYDDFLELVLPKESAALSSRASLRESYSARALLPVSVVEGLVNLLQKELEQVKARERLGEDLLLDPAFNSVDAFAGADVDNLGHLDTVSINRFLRSHDIYLNDSELAGLFRRVDFDRDNRISLAEFRAVINAPVSETSLRASQILRSASRERLRQRSPSPARLTESRYSASRLSPSRNVDDIEYRTYVRRTEALSPLRSYSPSRNIEETLRSSRRFLERETLVTSPSRGRLGKSEVVAPLRRSYSPLKDFEEEELVRQLREQIDLNREVEAAKASLARRADFNLMDAFRTFDTEERGWCSPVQLERALSAHGVYPGVGELDLLVKRLDTLNEGRIRFSAFSQMILPSNSLDAELMKSRVPTYSPLRRGEVPFSLETQRQLAALLRIILTQESAIESARRRITAKRGYSFYDAFDLLDSRHKGYVTSDEFQRLFNRHGIYASNREVSQIIGLLDTNKDGRVTASEFYRELSPQSRKRLVY